MNLFSRPSKAQRLLSRRTRRSRAQRLLSRRTRQRKAQRVAKATARLRSAPTAAATRSRTTVAALALAIGLGAMLRARSARRATDFPAPAPISEYGGVNDGAADHQPPVEMAQAESAEADAARAS